jgi:hypothetical protein
MRQVVDHPVVQIFHLWDNRMARMCDPEELGFGELGFGDKADF